MAPGRVAAGRPFWPATNLRPSVSSHRLPGPMTARALINAVLAESLGAKEGDAILLRLPKRSDVPADSPLGRREIEAASARLRVKMVLPADGLGQFSLRPTQVTQPLILVPLETAQRLADRVDVANVCLAVAAARPELERPTLIWFTGWRAASSPRSRISALSSRPRRPPLQATRRCGSRATG